MKKRSSLFLVIYLSIFGLLFFIGGMSAASAAAGSGESKGSPAAAKYRQWVEEMKTSA